MRDHSNGVQPITRLDYRVAGLALFSKTKSAERYLFRQMQQRRVQKRYKIMVDGIGYNPWYRANNKLISTFKAVENCDGKIAKSAFVKKLELNNESYFDVATKTGRRHRIRYHAASLISPIKNDELYGYPSKNQHTPIGLLASELRFQWNQENVIINLGKRWETMWMSIVNEGRPLASKRGRVLTRQMALLKGRLK